MECRDKVKLLKQYVVDVLINGMSKNHIGKVALLVYFQQKVLNISSYGMETI